MHAHLRSLLLGNQTESIHQSETSKDVREEAVRYLKYDDEHSNPVEEIEMKAIRKCLTRTDQLYGW